MATWARAVAVLSFWLILPCGGRAYSAETAGKWLNKPVPAFSASDLDGKEVRLADLLGRYRVVVLNFWGVRCQSCLEEMPHLGALAAKFGNSGVGVVGVNSDGLSGDSLRETLPKVGVTRQYTLVADPEFKVMDGYGVNAVPYTLLIRADGQGAYEHLGFSAGDEKTIESELLKLVGESGR